MTDGHEHGEHHEHGEQSEGQGPGDALKKDWEQTKSDVPGLEGEDIGQDVDDTVKDAAGGGGDDNS